MLKNRLAAIAAVVKHGEHKFDELFKIIVMLRTGEALVFAPAAVLDVLEAAEGLPATVKTPGHSYVKIRVREWLTADGGKSIMASDRQKVEAKPVEAAKPAAMYETKSILGVKGKRPEASENEWRVDVVLRAADQFWDKDPTVLSYKKSTLPQQRMCDQMSLRRTLRTWNRLFETTSA
jgi:hypothetical protein